MKRSIVVVLVIFLMVVMGACGKSAKSPESSTNPNSGGTSNEAPTKIKFKVVSLSTNEPSKAEAEMFIKELKEKSNGVFDPQLFINGQLGDKDEDLTTSVETGAIEVYMSADMLVSQTSPKWSELINTPFMFKDEAHVQKFWNSEKGKQIQKEVKDKNDVQLLIDDIAVNPGRNLLANKKITSISDMKGLKMRTPNIPGYINAWKLTGALITPVPWGELYGALQSGLVNASEMPVISMSDNSIQEVQKFVMMTNHGFVPEITHVNGKFWDSLTPELQKAMVDAQKAGAKAFMNTVGETNNKLMEQYKSQGVTFISPPELDVDSFRKVVLDGVIKANQGAFPENGVEFINSLLK